MVSELRDVRDFLGRHAPFSSLPGDALDRLPRSLSVRYLRRGSEFPPADADIADFHVIRKGAVELRDDAGDLVEKLAEGDSLDASAVDARNEKKLFGITVEDTLVYVLPSAVLAGLRKDHRPFDDSFETSIRERLHRARESAHDAPQAGGNLLRLGVGDLIVREAVTADAKMSVQDAARLMTRERVSSLLVLRDGELEGIVTDRDLRIRLVAEGRDGATLLREIMTPRPHTIPRSASAFEALMAMSRLRIHHLPVVDRDGLQGMVSTHDLLRAQGANPLYLADRIRRCASIEELRQAAGEVRELHVQLVAAHASARQLGQALTSVCDAVTRRLIELAIQRLGEPPVPFAWVATGSQGRGELTLHSDQDNAIILGDDFASDRHGEYFAELASAVNKGLDASGYALCPGDVMASNSQWRQPLAVWRGYFTAWLEKTDHKAAMLAANFFDMRTIWGEDELRQRLMAQVLPRCRGEKVFLSYMASHALGNRPPLGFFRNFVLVRSGEHEGAVDLKRHGLLPIVDLARVYALAGGVESVGTLERLQGSLAADTLSEEGSENLAAAFEFISMIRATHQAEQLRGGGEVDNYVMPDALTTMERRHLKDAFAAIATLQDALRAAHSDRLPR
jgi:CBS domain-containing protein